MLWNHGHGANGKSLINEIIATVMGSYAGSIDIKVLTGEDKRDAAQATPDLMLLPGRRFIRTSEPERETPLQEAKIKRMTGQDPLQVRALNQDFVEVKLIGKLVVSGNHLPKVIGDDDGIWRRLLLVNWSVQIPEGERDHDLLAKIVGEEASGVLNWLVEGCIEYLEEGLNPPKEVRQWVEDFRRDSDEIGDFLTESTEVTGDPEDFIKGRDLVEAVQFWQRDKGGTPYLARTIENKLKQQKAGVFKVKGKTFNAGKQGGQRGYFGLKFIQQFDDLFRAARAKAESRRGGSSSEAGI
jgi:putative DNA primase/helicase